MALFDMGGGQLFYEQHGSGDPPLVLVRDRAPHAQIAMVPGVGHFSMIEAPDDVNRHMEAILEKLAGG